MGKNRRMSLDEVRKLRIGQRVDLVFDRSGTRQQCVIETISNGKIKVMSCVREDGSKSTYPIIGYSGAHYEEAEGGKK